ncbi:MAG: FN3 associated domain-containing protein [Marinilabiliaceae bacterium]|jgi:hypothetical protein|nr:FN3 associated domain-containing protein [Marinilabiliaceae bacterium]
MNKLIIILPVLLTLALNSCKVNQSADWSPADAPLLTQWAEDINPELPWDKYPRPGMERAEWLNLNGLWDFAISNKDEEPQSWNSRILVPYPVESALSGIAQRVDETQQLWYRREIKIPSAWKNRNLIINFEASDWETTLYIDDRIVGTHRGGYDPFCFDISGFVATGKTHELKVAVWDPTDKGNQPRGKQVSEPHGIWYTPSSGIWQTVWIEPLGKTYIKSFRTDTDIDKGTLKLSLEVYNLRDDISLSVNLMKDGKIIAGGISDNPEEISIDVKDFELWSPSSPVLYDLEINLCLGEEILDKVKSYTGFRKVSLGDAGDGFTRILLNNRFVFQNGPLDQGFWPDGLYTPPTEEAMIYDLEMTRKMGFNMLRKHVKVENRRFYYWCDKMGLLVWQDMPSGDKYIGGNMPDIEKSESDADQFIAELSAMIDTKYNNPSIIVWVPFNEGWGQYNTAGITDFIKGYDSTRLVNSASGWTDRGCGDILDIHHYPDPRMPEPESERAIVLGEFGGLGLPVQDHTWEQKNWGYRTMENTDDLLARYEEYYSEVYKMVDRGLSAVVYTQTTDVETETNGLMTYDRARDKMGYANVEKANMGISPPYLLNDTYKFIDTYIVEFGCRDKNASIYYTLDGSDPDTGSPQYSEPFEINKEAEIKALAVYDGSESRIISFKIEKAEIKNAAEAVSPAKGISVKIYQGRWTEIPDFDSLEPSGELIAEKVSTAAGDNRDYMGLVFEGYLKIEDARVYRLSLNSDDGSRLILNDEVIVENNGIHGMREQSSVQALGKGYHKIRIEYFQGTGGIGLEFNIWDKDAGKRVVPAKALFH